MGKKYTLDQIQFLREGYQTMSTPELTKAFNNTFGGNNSEMSIFNLLRYYGITGKKRSSQAKLPKAKRYSEEQLEFLRVGYKKTSIKSLTAKFNVKFSENRSEIAIHGAIQTHNLRSKRAPGLPTSQKRDVGYERVCSNTGFITIKTAEENPFPDGRSTLSRHKHKIIWEEANGPRPKGHCLRFLDGSKQNCTLDNLGLFTRTESMFMSMMKHDSAPPELRETIRLTAKLKAKVAERKRELMEGENA